MKKELYAEYEKIVTGQKKTFSSSFFKGNEETAKENAVFIMKYVFEKFLEWNPDDIANSVNMNIQNIWLIFCIQIGFIIMTQILRWIRTSVSLPQKVAVILKSSFTMKKE